MCDCIEVQSKALLEQNLLIATESLINMKTDTVRQVMPIPVVRAYSDRPKSKTKFMIPVFCAICGERLLPEAKHEDPT